MNDWLHPQLVIVIQHLRVHYPDAVYEVLGHCMAIEMKTYNLRQRTGSVFLALSMLMLIGGVFSTTLLGVSILFMAIGGSLIMFGLSAFTRHAIQIDIRQPNPVLAVSDAGVWASVMGLVR